jgi:hypothetical protein
MSKDSKGSLYSGSHVNTGGYSNTITYKGRHSRKIKPQSANIITSKM